MGSRLSISRAIIAGIRISLGTQRAVVKVAQPGAVAKAFVEWRRRDDAADKAVIVVDAKSNKRIWNVKAEGPIARERHRLF